MKGWVMRARENEGLFFTVLLFSIAIFLFCLAQGAVSAVYPSYLKSFVLKAHLVGLLAALVYIIQLPVSGPVGALSDTTGRKKLLIVSLSAFAGVEVLYFINHHLIALILLQLLAGLLMVTVFVSSEAFIRDISPPEKRGEIRSFFGTWVTAGYLIGPVIGGWIGNTYSIRIPFLLSAAFMLLSLLLLSGLRDDRSHGNKASMRDRVSLLGPVRRFFSLGEEICYLSLSAIVLYFWYATKWIYAPLYLLHLGYDLSIVGIWLGASLLPLIILQIPAGILGDRIGKDRVIMGGIIISSIFIAPLGFISSLNGLILAILIISSGSAMIEPLINARITDIIPKESYGEYSGVFEGTKILGCILGPVVTGFIVELAGFRYAFVPSAILFFLLIVGRGRIWA